MEGKRMDGKCIILCAPSGAGKTSITKYLLQQDLGLEFSISACNREQRENETNGVDYQFLTTEDFKNSIENEEFAEWEEVYKDNYYGTLKTEVTDCVKKGMDVLIDIDVQGMRQVRKASEGNDLLMECCTYIFIAPPSYKELEARLRKRATDEDSVVERRMLNARKELKAWNEYDYLIINDEVAKAASRLQAVIEADCIRTQRLSPDAEWPYV